MKKRIACIVEGHGEVDSLPLRLTKKGVKPGPLSSSTEIGVEFPSYCHQNYVSDYPSFS